MVATGPGQNYLQGVIGRKSFYKGRLSIESEKLPQVIRGELRF